MPIIRPQIVITPDCPTVKFREDPTTINLAIELPKILAQQGWSLGTMFCIQFVNHEETKLIKFAKFVVSSEEESMHTFNPESAAPMTKLIQSRTAKQTEGWFYPDGAPVKDLKYKWNPGKKEHQVRQGDKVLGTFKDRPAALEYIEKAA